MTELLAPAGSVEAFEAAIRAGADAVYLGGERFGARAYAANFDKKTLLSVIDQAHLFDKKIYLTVNTLIKESEMPDLLTFIRPYYQAGLDAVIIQDLGAVKMVRERFPGLHIHASTQMTVTGYHGASFLRKNGVDRVVPARELSLEEIKQIRDHSDIEIECFVHGALCYSYSGQCLMSSAIGGRSGNRGRCAQPCRLPYTVFENGIKRSTKDSSYSLNTKDICTVEILPRIVEAGVDSLKIEGRMKRPEYTAGVVSVYRKYLDLYQAGENVSVERKDLRFLFDLFNRDGFSKSYYQVKNGPEMMAFQNKKQSGEDKRQADACYEVVRETILSKEPKIRLKANALITKEEARLTLLGEGKQNETAEAVSQEVQGAINHELTKEAFLKQLTKTGGSDYQIEPGKIRIDPGVFMTIKDMNELRRSALSLYEQKKCARYRREFSNSFERDHKDLTFLWDNNSDYIKEDLIDGPQISVSICTRDQLYAALSIKEIANIQIPVSYFQETGDGMLQTAQTVQNEGKTAFLKTAAVSRRADRGAYRQILHAAAEKGMFFLSNSLEDITLLLEMGLSDRIRTDYGLYTMNSLAKAFLLEHGIRMDTVPLELSGKELNERDNRSSEMLIYGRIPLMISAQCIEKNYNRCTKNGARLILQDRKNYRFPVFCDCGNCQNIIYNSVPLSLISKKEEVSLLKPGSVRFSFTDEDAKTVTKRVRGWIMGGHDPEDFEFTRGHFTKGVE